MANTKNITFDQLQLSLERVKSFTEGTYSKLGHVHGTNEITKLTEYVIAAPTATTGDSMYLALKAGDSLNVALGKLDRTVSNIVANIGTIDVANHNHDTLYYRKGEIDQLAATIREELASGDSTTLENAKAYTDKEIAGLVDSAPETLDTLKELAEALGNDENFAATMVTELGKKVAGPDSAVVDHIAIFGSTDGKSVKDSGFTIQTSVPENALFTDYQVTSAPVASGALYLVGTGKAEGGTGTLKFSTGVQIDPATNTLTASVFSGRLAGKADTAGTADTAIKTQADLTLKLDGAEVGKFNGNQAVELNVTPEAIDVHRKAYTEKATDQEVTTLLNTIFGASV